MFFASPFLQTLSHWNRTVEVTTHVTTNMNLDFGRRLGAEMGKEGNQRIDPVHRYAEVFRYRLHIGVS
jgi:hypothetical protein